MNPAHLANIVLAECVKLSTRLSARLGILLSIGIGLSMPLLMFALNTQEASMNGATMADTLQASAPKGALWSLYLRNLWVMQAVVLLLCAQSLAGERSARTLREDLLRPVSRATVLFAKYVAIGVFVAATLTVQYVASTGIGLLCFGMEGPWKDVLFGYLASGLSDLSFAAVAFAIAAVLRSVSGTILVTFLFIVFEKLFAWTLFVVSGIAESMPPEMNTLPPIVFEIFKLQPGLPSTAWEVGSTLGGGGEIPLVTWAAVSVYLLVGCVVAWITTEFTEIP